MDKVLIRNWNERVKPEDTIFHLGDFCFKGGEEGGKKIAAFYEKQLNGKIILIKGNHDHNNSSKTIIEDVIIKHGGKHFHLVHDPKDAEGEYSLCGHIHKNWKSKKIGENIIINVGVDVWDFRPITIQEILGEISKIKRGT